MQQLQVFASHCTQPTLCTIFGSWDGEGMGVAPPCDLLK